MNSALYQELIDPSKFNIYAVITLLVLIVLCILVLGISFIIKKDSTQTFNKRIDKSGKGF